MKPPLVTFARSAWRELLAMACGHVREGGGLTLGKRTRYGNYRIEKVTGMTHKEADEGHVYYTGDEIAQARIAAYAIYKPLEAVGMWHTHPYRACIKEALEPQISDNWKDHRSDVSDMIDGDIEIIAVVFPYPGYVLSKSEFVVQSKPNGFTCRVEAWKRVRRGKVVPCRTKVRY